MRLKVKFEGYIDLDEEQIEFFKDENKGTIERKMKDVENAIKDDIKRSGYLKIKNISVEEESKT